MGFLSPGRCILPYPKTTKTNKNMALIDDFKSVLDQLAPHGWEQLFNAHGFDVNAKDLKQECLKTLTVDRSFPGFEDFSMEGDQGISPGVPARSLVYHAFASPNVIWSDKARKVKIKKFASLAQLEIIENFVYGIESRSLAFLQSRFPVSEFPDRLFGVVVFANQYHSAADTPHKKHADLVYSRTGLSRVGTAPMEYVAETRSFTPTVAGDPNKIRVLPARYSPYLAVRIPGSSELLGSRFNMGDQWFEGIPGDEDLSFWYPIHKLFDGRECLQGFDLKLELKTKHTNEKINRIHKFIAGEFNIDPGSNPNQHGSFPFSFSTDIADFDQTNSLVVPIPSTELVAKAEVGTPVSLDKSFSLPTTTNRGDSLDSFSSSLEIRAGAPAITPIVRTGNPRRAPEYMHVRSQLTRTGSIKNLNDQPSMIDTIENQSYKAVHYVDFTGDGFVSVDLSSDRPINLVKVSAYSLVSAPDFFPFVEQSEVLDATIGQGQNVWSTPPLTLADTRILPNVSTHSELIYQGMEVFDTCTALIAGVMDDGLQPASFRDRVTHRVSYLTDGAAGVFAPGWDTSFDMMPVQNRNVPHLSSYGLGSPFPEDAKLCAALSSFWPAVAPDISRSFWPANRPTVFPLLDSEIGAHGAAKTWDGEHGPTKLTRAGREVIRYKRFEFVDYTLNAENGAFDFQLLAGIDADEYLGRILKLKLIKDSQGVRNWLLSSYTQVGQADADVQALQSRDGVTLQGVVHKFVFVLPGSQLRVQSDFQMVDVEVDRERTFLVDDSNQVFVL